jgi:hypothetical protein
LNPAVSAEKAKGLNELTLHLNYVGVPKAGVYRLYGWIGDG